MIKLNSSGFLFKNAPFRLDQDRMRVCDSAYVPSNRTPEEKQYAGQKGSFTDGCSFIFFLNIK